MQIIQTVFGTLNKTREIIDTQIFRQSPLIGVIVLVVLFSVVDIVSRVERLSLSKWEEE
jgi:hypothetical protein